MRPLLFLIAASAAWSQTVQPNLVNAQLETHSYSGNLEQQIRADRATWFGYLVKSPSRDSRSCCWNGSNQCGCSLEGNNRSSGVRASSSSPVLLEGSDSVAVLYRVSNNNIEKIQVYSLSCPLDAGGLPFVWLSGVPQEASLAFLEKAVGQSGAIFAIAQHAGSRSTDILIHLAQQDPSPRLREDALFWLSQRAGDRAAATITNAILNDPDGGVKKKAVFALSQLPKDEGIPKLIEVARTQRNPEVRKQAFFWLGQSHDPRAFAYIQEVLAK